MDDPEKSELAHPHDLLVRNVLADADLAADLLRNYLDPKLAAAVDLDSLQRESGDTVSPELSKLVGDLRYSATFKGSKEKVNVFVLLEHQSSPDRLMSFRMLEYICAEYRQRVPALKKGVLFPYPLAVVLHHGKSPWKEIPSMRELIAMRPGVPNDILGLPICLIDAAAMSMDELHGHPMVCALLDSLQSGSMGVSPSRLQGIFARLRDLGGDRRIKSWLEALTRYHGAVWGKPENFADELVHAYTGLYGKEEAGKMAMSALEALLTEGAAKGRVEGRVEGKAEAIVSVLKSRFGTTPATVQRKLRNLRDNDRIEEMLELAAICQSLKEFQKAL